MSTIINPTQYWVDVRYVGRATLYGKVLLSSANSRFYVYGGGEGVLQHKAWLSHPHGVGFGVFSRFWVGFPTRPEMVGWEHLPPETPTAGRWDWDFEGLGESWKILMKFVK